MSVETPGDTQLSLARRTMTGLWHRMDRIPLEYVFVAIALFWGMAQVFVVPPLQVPDEADHWFRAWAMTDGRPTADPDGMLTLPGAFRALVTLDLRLRADGDGWPQSLSGRPGFSGYSDLFDSPGSDPARIASSVRNYGPLGYLPQTAGVTLGRLLGPRLSRVSTFARLANLLVSVGLLFLAIRIAPVGKHIFMLMALLPMTMSELGQRFLRRPGDRRSDAIRRSLAVGGHS